MQQVRCGYMNSAWPAHELPSPPSPILLIIYFIICLDLVFSSNAVLYLSREKIDVLSNDYLDLLCFYL